MNPIITFRSATPKDLQAIMTVEKESFDPAIVEDEATFLERIKVFSNGFLIACIEDEAIGYICSELWHYEKEPQPESFSLDHSIGAYHHIDGNELYISSIGLLKKYRGLGCGSMLLTHLLSHFKNRGIKSAILSVAYEFGHAKTMYEKMGFKPLFDIPSLFPFSGEANTNGLVMRMQL